MSTVIAAIGGGLLGASVVNGARWWLRHHGPRHLHVRLPIVASAVVAHAKRGGPVTCGEWHGNLCTQPLDHDSICTPNGVDAYTDRLIEKYTGRTPRARAQAALDREALESRGVQIPDTDSARIIAARARTQHVGDQPVRMVWTRGRGWHWDGGQ